MQRLKELYRENINGIIGTLVFHILLFVFIILANVKVKEDMQEEEIVVDFSQVEETPEIKEEQLKQEEENTPSTTQDNSYTQSRSNRAVNDAAKKDPFS